MTVVISARRLAAVIGELDDDGPAYLEISDRIRVAAMDGRLADGARLPSERELASALGVSRTTTTRVYAELRDAGLVESRRGSGSTIALPMQASSASTLIGMHSDTDTLAFTYSAPVGPPGMARAFERACEKLPGLLATSGYLPDGLPVLRELLAQYYSDRGLPTDPGQIIVTSGAMGAISLLARTLLSRGDRVMVEGSSYPHAHDALVAAGGRLSALPVGDSPWDTEAMTTTLAAGRHALAYLIPDFHNPTAAVMSGEERERWAHELRRHGVTAIIDESMREVNLDGIDLPPSLAALDPSAVVLGSSSKPFWGGLRVGWMRVPRHLVMSLVQARMIDDLSSSAFDQMVFAELLTDGGQTAAAGRAALRTGRDHLLAELATHVPEISAPCPAGGLNLWVTLPGRLSTRLCAAAERRGLLLTPGPRFFSQGGTAGERHLRLPYAHSPERLTEGVARLRLALDDVQDGRAASLSRGTSIDLIA
ncbi:MAG: PLP-dependent aminotransferase family protein [Aeromicrobium sp.]|uniref:MocR-like transcription factor YczR n=1 Tax=Aeromicrobium sp. TaxID=1871063 RepID=UPI0025C0EF58|nr:PLP-dependent aminotransferase family protein [Aeromicrobium sp.]MCK5891131.1 PLP-dependent aminotransferase family protein [Aeromicrobium sp.]MDF1705480.1 PLP-dependent aminotransferase family protein [Aeromicrobium sp.]